jgi:site-specific DNA recombinase
MIANLQPPASGLKPVVRCAVYVRKSHEEGLDQPFNSLHAQQEACLAYVQSQGWEALPDEYADGGYTGGNLDRPAMQRLIRDIEAAKVDCVVVHRVDRLSRSLMDFARMMAMFERHGVWFCSVTQQFNTTTSMGRLTLNILLSFAQFEREIIAERIRDKISAAKKRGQWIGGHPFLGYDIDHANRRLLVNEQEARLVRHIFERFGKTGSCLKLARELNRQGHRTKSWKTAKGKVAGGRPWNKVYVHRILTNPKYIGLIDYKGQNYAGQHQAIIGQGTWDRVRAILARNSRHRAAQTRRKTAALLKGLLRCGQCGRAMGATFTNRRGKRYRYYLCNHAEKNGYDTCPVKSIAAGEIEAAVVDQLRGLFRSPDMIAGRYRAMLEQAGQHQEAQRREKDALQRRLAELGKMIRNVARATGEGPAAAMAEELRKLNEECSAVEARLGELAAQVADEQPDVPTEQDVAEALRNIDPAWEELFPAEKERVVHLLVEQVVVDSDSMTLKLRPVGIGTLVSEMSAVADGVEERLVTA